MNNSDKILEFYNLFNVLNKKFINKIFNLIDKYLVLPGKTIEDLENNEISETNSFNIIIKYYDENSIIENTLKKFKYGEELYKLLTSKMCILHHFILELLNTAETDRDNLEANSTKFFDEIIEAFAQENDKFLTNLRERYGNELKFLTKTFDSDDGYKGEKEQIQKIIENNFKIFNEISYNFTLESLFNYENEIIYNKLHTVLELFIENEKSKLYSKQLRIYNELEIENFTDDDLLIKLNLGYYEKDNNGKIHYFIDKVMNLRKYNYSFSIEYRAYFNLVFLPFFTRLNFAIQHKEVDNLIIQEEFNHSSKLSPYSNYIYYEMKETNQNDDYRKLLTDMGFIFNYSFIFNKYFYSPFDYIKELTEKNTKENIQLFDTPNEYLIFFMRNNHANNFIDAANIIELVNSIDSKMTDSGIKNEILIKNTNGLDILKEKHLSILLTIERIVIFIINLQSNKIFNFDNELTDYNENMEKLNKEIKDSLLKFNKKEEENIENMLTEFNNKVNDIFKLLNNHTILNKKLFRYPIIKSEEIKSLKRFIDKTLIPYLLNTIYIQKKPLNPPIGSMKISEKKYSISERKFNEKLI